MSDVGGIRSHAQRLLAQRNNPIELLRLPIVFGSPLNVLEPGDSVTVDLALQKELNVYEPAANALWLVHQLRVEQHGPVRGRWSVDLSRRLPDRRERDFWSEDRETTTTGRNIVIGVASGLPQVAAVIPSQEVIVGRSITIDLSTYFTDPDADPLTFVAIVSDDTKASALINGDMLTITGVAAGSVGITVTASDRTASVAQLVTVEVVANRAPVLSTPIANITTQVIGTRRINLANHFTDTDGDTLSYSATSSHTDIATATVNGALLDIGVRAVGTSTITIVATDPGGLTVTVQVSLEVRERTVQPDPGGGGSQPQPPSGSGGAPYVANSFPTLNVDIGSDNFQGSTLSRFTDPGGLDLTITASSDNSDFTTSIDQDGTQDVRVAVSSSADDGDTATITVTATNSNGQSVSATFTARAVDDDDDSGGGTGGGRPDPTPSQPTGSLITSYNPNVPTYYARGSTSGLPSNAVLVLFWVHHTATGGARDAGRYNPPVNGSYSTVEIGVPPAGGYTTLALVWTLPGTDIFVAGNTLATETIRR